MLSRTTAGAAIIPEQGETAAGRANLSTCLGIRLYFQALQRSAAREAGKNSRENNRTVTGAYQGDIRGENGARWAPRLSPTKSWRHADDAWL
jgi:hypothetical protein